MGFTREIFVSFLLPGLLLATGATVRAERDGGGKTDPWFQENNESLVDLYKHLHSHPELSFREEQTARTIAEELKKAGAEVTTGIGKLGLVGVLKNGEGPTILVRSDLDALPVHEETGLAYASTQVVKDVEGKPLSVMHACGHDIHMACLVGTARWLNARREHWRGTVLLVGQPAEEAVGGARAMLADGLYERFPRPDAALALHVTHDQPTGIVAYTSGPALAGATSVNVTIRGKGGHGAAPHTTVDPIFLAALVVIDLQSIHSREIDPLQPSVITVGSIHGGTRPNIIPNEVRLELTLRAFREDVRDQLVEGIQRRINGLAQAHRAPAPAFTITESTPPTVNTPALVTQVVPALNRELGSDHVKVVEPVMGAEDFGLFGQGGVPTFMFRVGSVSPARFEQARKKGEALPSLHSSTFAPEPSETIRTGVRAMTAALVELTGRPRTPR
ncbi:MAG: M20 family metallopeptidase [Isosphaeraceae bacterium]